MKRRKNSTKWKACFPGILLLCMAILLPGLPAAAESFSDVPKDAWYAPAVEYVREKNLMSGVGNGRFVPDGTATREMFVQVLYQMAEHTEQEGTYPNQFRDFPQGWWSQKAVNWAFQKGIAEGTGKFRFSPSLPVTREQMAQFLYRFAEATENGVNGFPDKDPPAGLENASQGARKALSWAWNRGILRGDADGRLRPRDTATRAEMAQVIQQADQILKNRKVWVHSRMSDLAKEAGITQLPRIDGSTSTLGMNQAAFSLLVDAPDGITFPVEALRTVPSYKKLMDGGLDIILVPYASPDMLELAESKGVELEFHKVSLEALVFITPKENPTENITEQQVRSIYRDYGISNWKALGGPEKELVPLCRNADSGSQSQMENLILKGEPMHPDIENNFVLTEMPTMLRETAHFHESGRDCYALGYTMYAYLNYNIETSSVSKSLKMLSYEGIAPTAESLGDGGYPLTDGYYAVLRKDTPQNSNTRKLLKWMGTDAYRQEICSMGFFPALR